jgi:hypothetical protein
MHPAIRQYYQQRFSQFQSPMANELRQIVTASTDVTTKIVRPDARLFLLANMDEMVARPLSRPNSPTSFFEIRTDLQADIRVIVAAAEEVAGNRQDLAASHVLWGTAQVLDQLHLKNWRLWEKDE